MDKNKKKKLLSSMWESFQSSFLKYLEETATKMAIKAVLGTAAATGFKAWLVKFVVKEIIIDEVSQPLVKAAFVEIGYKFDKINGSIYAKRLANADTLQEYNDAVDDINS
jgi:hypothetical protein